MFAGPQSEGPPQISSSCGILTACYLCNIFDEAAHQLFKCNLTKIGVQDLAGLSPGAAVSCHLTLDF